MALPCAEYKVLHEIQNCEGQLESSQISCPLKITSLLTTPNLLTENASFLKRAVHSQPNLSATTWLKIRAAGGNLTN